MNTKTSIPSVLQQLKGPGAVLLLLITLRLAAANGPAPASASGPIALTSDDRFVWVVNPDNNSVSVIEVGNDVNQRVNEIQVGEEPTSVAITPDNRKVYVTDRRSGTVSVIDASSQQAIGKIKVGTEPAGCAITPDGKKLYVANSSSGSISIINTRSDQVLKTIENVGPKPTGIAIAGDKVYVTLFLAQPVNDNRSADEKEGRDDGKEGLVIVLSANNDKVTGTVVLNHLEDTGFKSQGSLLDRQLGSNPGTNITAAFPNLLQSIVVRGDRAYLPNVGDSPNGPFRFNVNVQALLSVFDTATDTDSDQTINMNKGIQFESAATRLFITTPIAIAFKHSGDEGFVVAAGINQIVRVQLDANGKPTINAPTSMTDTGNVVRIAVGLNPQGIVVNSTDTRAYAMNFISRDVSVVDISDSPANYHQLTRVQSADLPTPGTLAAAVHRGNELFNASVGPAGTAGASVPPAGRMSNSGWGNCYNCHPRGLTDGTTWMFPDGPRQTISMESTAEHPQPADALLNANFAPLLPSFKQRMLNWSAIRDEIQDFELNIRAVSGGQGLIRLANGAQDPCVFNLVLPPGSTCSPETAITTGRDADLDALAAYNSFGIKAPISPRRGQQDVHKGRELFTQANCQSCHGGPNWTVSRVDFTPPPAVADITGGQIVRFLKDVGTFDTNNFNEVRQQVDAAGVLTGILRANGSLGFNPPSLLSVFAGAPYLHSGNAQTLDEVLENPAHRTAGLAPGQEDVLADANDRRSLVRFLESIDGETEPINP